MLKKTRYGQRLRKKKHGGAAPAKQPDSIHDTRLRGTADDALGGLTEKETYRPINYAI